MKTRQALAATMLVFAVWALAAAPRAAAQTREAAPAPHDPATRQTVETRATADERFELDIAERRITRTDYEASTSVEAGDGETGRGLRLEVGVSLGATNIDVSLRNVRGLVRFRGSLDALLERLNARVPASASPQSMPPSPTPSNPPR